MERTNVSPITKDEIKAQVANALRVLYRKTVDTATPQQIYGALAYAVKEYLSEHWIASHDRFDEPEDVKIVYYLSMEFLMGRFLGNTLINLGLKAPIAEVMEELGINYNLIEEQELDPGLGNGGLGRLAACFLDSMATIGYPAYGCGIRYHYGLFEQRIENGAQVEYPDNWMKNGDPWSIRRDEYAVEVKFGGRVNTIKDDEGQYHFVLEDYQSIRAIPYDYPVVGYNSGIVNTLRLWDAEAIERFDLKSFNEGNYQRAREEQNLAEMLSRVLYPADDNMAGKELRLKQQYFFISATLQRVTQRFINKHEDWSTFPNYVQFQLNDTHPALAVAELMRIFVDTYYLDWDEAWEITRKACAYTNHTILSEALEKWPVELFSRLLPRIYTIVEEINRRFCANLITWYGNDPDKIRKMAIVADGQVRMAHLAIVGSHSVNGVAAIHTNILKDQELADFFHIYPEKFNNKTNGITQRRWLAHCNPRLSELITNNIGDSWLLDLDELAKLKPLADDSAFRKEFMKIKRDNKVDLSNYINDRYGIMIDPDSVFDVQVKRLHEYKRQLLNIFHVIDLYNTLKLNPNMNFPPRTFIFSAKAHANYYRAKLIIRLITAVAGVVNNDPSIEGRIKVLFLENYRVTLAEKLVPAADVSEQISTAGKEASGTGNMKFMLNGAVTIGTMDGANVEIFEEVGDDNIFIFGMSAPEVLALKQSGSYAPWDISNMDYNIRLVLTTLINGTLSSDHELFRELYDAMLNGYGGAPADEYFVLQDFKSYKEAHEKLGEAYQDQDRWAKMAIMNTACSGKFSSDRTIRQYAEEIWNVKAITIEKK
ncbi:MAG: glycogen/starch/alpha-glucan phosphorylase [Defluviitaleaceae bacterium]|nr:glycogen/starch/alpha-glucan phosphorylase [Defluviitaleaceae bacterium]